MTNIKPPPLKAGDRIGIVSPARFIVPSEIEGALQWIKEMGFEAVLGDHVFDQFDQFAGNDADRASDIARFLNDPDISCIWATRGGYGSIRLIPFLKDVNPTVKPKWFVGYSDMTVFHSWLGEKFGLQAIHGPMLFSWGDEKEKRESFTALGEVLTKGGIEYSYPVNMMNRGSKMEGILTGGNLSMILSMRGTDLDLDVNGKVLFIEDLDEYLYHIDRIMQNLKRAGWLSEISGLLVGGMSDMNDNDIPFGMNPEEIILDTCSEYKFPIFFGHPSGHQKQNMPLILGERIQLSANGGQVTSIQ